MTGYLARNGSSGKFHIVTAFEGPVERGPDPRVGPVTIACTTDFDGTDRWMHVWERSTAHPDAVCARCTATESR